MIIIILCYIFMVLMMPEMAQPQIHTRFRVKYILTMYTFVCEKLFAGNGWHAGITRVSQLEKYTSDPWDAASL